jgi:predicted nucleic acid-binding protein
MVVDASVWVSGLLPEDVHHRPSRRWLEDQQARDIALVVPTLALAEVGGAVARRVGVPELGRQAAEELRLMPGLRLVSLDPEMGAFAAEVAARLQLRGGDAVYVAAARTLDLPLVTWDQEIMTRAQGFVRVFEPA